MTIRKLPATLLFASVLALSGCFGTSDDKGDNTGKVFTPKPGGPEDANTVGSRKSVLPVPPEAKPDAPKDAEPK